MSHRRLFDHDPVMGITRYFDYDPLTDQATISSHQTLDPLLERNVQEQNAQTSLDRWGDGRVVASVPMSIYSQWVAEGKDKDDAFLKRWLNDPENRKFRRFRGRV